MEMCEYDDRVDEEMEQLSVCLKDLGGAERAMTEDMLRMYVWYHVNAEDLRKTLDMEGLIVETPRGQKEHTANALLHKYTQRMGDFYSKIVKVIGRNNPVAADRLSQFVNRK